jgi:hypothetical protein
MTTLREREVAAGDETSPRQHSSSSSPQPYVDSWPMRDEDLSKISAAFDIERARERLARRFNSKPVRLSKEVEVERAWLEHASRKVHP